MEEKKKRKRREVTYEYGDPKATVRAVFSYCYRNYEEYLIARGELDNATIGPLRGISRGVCAIKHDEFGQPYTGTPAPERMYDLTKSFQITGAEMKGRPQGTVERMNEWMHQGVEPLQAPLSKKERREDSEAALAVVDASIRKGIFFVTPDYIFRLVSEGVPEGESGHGKKKR